MALSSHPAMTAAACAQLEPAAIKCAPDASCAVVPEAARSNEPTGSATCCVEPLLGCDAGSAPSSSSGLGEALADPCAVRSCSHCRTVKTPLWRNGPDGPKSLCNACGVRHKLGKLQRLPVEGSAPAPQPQRRRSELVAELKGAPLLAEPRSGTTKRSRAVASVAAATAAAMGGGGAGPWPVARRSSFTKPRSMLPRGRSRPSPVGLGVPASRPPPPPRSALTAHGGIEAAFIAASRGFAPFSAAAQAHGTPLYGAFAPLAAPGASLGVSWHLAPAFRQLVPPVVPTPSRLSTSQGAQLLMLLSEQVAGSRTHL